MASKITEEAILSSIEGIMQIIERDNLGMMQGAAMSFINASTWAVMQVNSGHMTTEKALHEGVRRLASQGIPIITYRNTKTGQTTVKNNADVAVRRHIRTQIAQDGMRLTAQRCQEHGVQLVEVSSSPGARESHAEWEGQIYALHGPAVVDGIEYDDFATACNEGDVSDGIGGANCTHSYAPWFPGMSRRYEPDPAHPSGKDNSEIADLTQNQRALEREIRANKREIMAVNECIKSASGDELVRLEQELVGLQSGLRDTQKDIRGLVSENADVLQRSPRREWAGDTK